ncbi:hypothetical protein [Streptomyces venezuelae]
MRKAPPDNGRSLSSGPICSEHEGPPTRTIRSSAGSSICPVCTPLGPTPAGTAASVRRQNLILDSPYWRHSGPCT